MANLTGTTSVFRTAGGAVNPAKRVTHSVIINYSRAPLIFRRAPINDQPAQVIVRRAQVVVEPVQVIVMPARVVVEPAQVSGTLAQVAGEPAQIIGKPARSAYWLLTTVYCLLLKLDTHGSFNYDGARFW